MKFWAIVNKNKRSEFYNFRINEFEFYLTSECLLPTKKMAIQELNNWIYDENKEYEVLEIKIQKYNEEKKKMKYTYTKPEGWV